MNQMNAGHENFKTLVESVLPVLSDSEQEEAMLIAQLHAEVAMNALNEVWRRKMGLAEWSSDAQKSIYKLLELMHDTEARRRKEKYRLILTKKRLTTRSLGALWRTLRSEAKARALLLPRPTCFTLCRRVAAWLLSAGTPGCRSG